MRLLMSLQTRLHDLQAPRNIGLRDGANVAFDPELRRFITKGERLELDDGKLHTQLHLHDADAIGPG